MANHKAKAVVVSCMDFRIQKGLQTWLEKNKYLGVSDEIIMAGASRDIVLPQKPGDRDGIMGQLKLSVALHDPDEILIVDHQDCGRYAQDSTIPSGLSVKDDISEHTKHLAKARKYLEEQFPGRKIRTIYMTLDNKFTELK